MPEPLEIVVYIHGVSQDLRGASHAHDYKRMHDGVGRRRNGWPSGFLGIEWGWKSNYGVARDQQLLTDAQRLLGEREFAAMAKANDFSINPGRAVVHKLRPLLFHGFGDMFYYVSAEGKRAVRSAVARQLCRHIERTASWDAPVSITLLGHSAGSVIAFDLAFFLFFASENGEHSFLPEGDSAHDDARKLRALAERGGLRIRRLITFGSPIAMMACRSDAVVTILASGEALVPADYGLVQNLPGAAELAGPRWLNIWDKDDPIAWPVAPLMRVNHSDGNSPVEDIYIDVSDSISRSHSEYWDSERVYKAIAARW